MKFPDSAVRTWVAGVLRGIYMPEPDEEIWEWAERTLRIPETENEELAGTFWKSSLTPYVREVMEWAKRPGKGEFWVKKSSQVGLTMACLIIICWMIVHRSGQIAYAMDTVHEAAKISRTRLQRWIKDNKLLDKIGEAEDGMSNLTYYLRGLTVYMLGAFSPGGWANKSIVFFILDELDKHPYLEGEGTTVSLARERCKRPRNAKILGFSSPGETDQISVEHEKGTKELIYIPFPCCGTMQPLLWDNMIFGSKEFRDLTGDYDLEEVRRHTYFRCSHCESGRLRDEQKNEAMQKYESRATNEKPTPNTRSLHIWDAYSPFVKFGELAVEWILAQGDVTLIERFMRGRRGEQYKSAGRELANTDIVALRGAYLRGECPIVPAVFCQTTDIQADVQKSLKVAFDAKGNCYVIDWYTTLSLDESCEWSYDMTRTPGDDVAPDCGLIDEGHKPSDTRRVCLKHFPKFWPVKGRGGIQVRATVATSVQEIDGEEILTYHIDDENFKWQLFHMIRDNKKRKEAKLPCLYFPHDVIDDDKFVDEFTTEYPVKERNKFNREIWKWYKKRDEANDFWDCLKYALALWYVKSPMIREEAREGLSAPLPAKG